MWQLTPPGYLVAGAVHGLFHAAAAFVAPAGRWGTIGRPLAHTLAEALRFSWPFGGVPLASVAIAEAAGPFAGTVRVGGAIALTWVVWQIGVALGDLVRRAAGAAVDVRLVAAGGLTAVAVALVSIVAPRGHGTGVVLDIAAVQGGGEQGTRADEVPSEVVTQRHLDATASTPPTTSSTSCCGRRTSSTSQPSPAAPSSTPSPPRRPASRCRSPWASRRTSQARTTGSPTPR